MSVVYVCMYECITDDVIKEEGGREREREQPNRSCSHCALSAFMWRCFRISTCTEPMYQESCM